MKTQDTSHWNRPLALIAWAAFVISFFLPSYANGRGYQCAIMQGYFWSGVTQGSWGAIHYELLTLANLLMLASPFLMLGFWRYSRGLRWMRYSTFVASVLVWSFLILLLTDQAGHDLRVGAFVWASSFVILWASSILPHKIVVGAGDLKHSTLCA